MIYRFYTLWAPVYDFFAGPLFVDFRRRAIASLELKPGSRLLIPGVGTGLDFPYLPRDVEIVGSDLNETMLARARRRADALGFAVRLETADAQALPYADASFDRAYLPCIACVAPDGGKVLAEALRIVKKGGLVVVIDKFLGEGRQPGVARRIAEGILGRIVSHVNRRWSEVAAGASGFTLLREEAGPLGGFFRMYVVKKN